MISRSRWVVLHNRSCAWFLFAFTLLIGLFQLDATGAHQRGGVNQGQIDRMLRRYDRLTLDPAVITRQVRDTGRFPLAAGGRNFDVHLAPHDLRAPGYRAEVELPDGSRRRLEPQSTRTFRGTVPGLADSDARFTLAGSFLEGVILTPDEWYYIEPLRNFSAGAEPSEMVFYRRSDIIPEAIGTCGTTVAHRIGKAHDFFEPRVLAASGGISTAEIATEADYEYVLAAGGAAEADATIMDIINQVDGIYQMELSVALQVVYQHAWESAGDPYVSTASSTMLTEFRDYWNGNFYSTPFDLAHMWTGKDMDGSTVGIAYLSVICDFRTYSYGISQRFSASPGKYILTAHEMGHNFGASHTEQADPPQTDCSNTIMNSSIGTGFTFCPYSRAEIAARLLQNSSCLASVPSSGPTITGMVPSSGGPGTTVTVTGTNLTGASAVRFNSTSASGFSVLSPTQLRAVVPVAATTGPITVVTPNGTAVSSANFTVTANRCDLNGDQSTNVLDIQLLINTILGLPGSPAGGDLNSDGSTNVLDLQILINVILGLRSCPG